MMIRSSTLFLLCVALAACDNSSSTSSDGADASEAGVAQDSAVPRDSETPMDGEVQVDSEAADAELDATPPPPACPSGCLVNSVCYPDGALNPTNPCQICRASMMATAFVGNVGQRCDDGAFCTINDVCSAAGTCVGAPRTCDDGIACNGAATCEENTASCTAGAGTCSGDQVCNASTGSCDDTCPGCLIAGTCYGDGQVNALNPCQVCDVDATRTAFSPNDGATCDDGVFCTEEDVCALGVCTGGKARKCDDGIACNGTETCDEAGNACAAGALTCVGASVCDVATDACVATCTGCVIDGVCFGAGQRNPANQCEVCAPGTSRSAFSPYDGASCDDNLFCTTGDVCTGTTCGGSARSCTDGISCNGQETCDEDNDRCASGTTTCAAGTLCSPASDTCVTSCAGCVIEGVCYGAGQVRPGNPCEVCSVSASATAWSPNDGARCDDGLFCTDADVCAARACGGVPRACSDGVTCNGVETCDEASDVCLVGATTCAAFEVCDTVANACVPTCAGCVISGVCHADGARNPNNECEICDVNRSRSSFSVNDGASCDDGAFCTRGDVCAGGLCSGTSANFCSDSIACNGVETCDEGTDRCVAGASTCGAGQVCDPVANACVTACSGCVIGGVCFAANTRNPADQCLVCSPSTSDTSWSPYTGASCDDGLFCTVGDTCSSAAVCSGSARSCDDGVACNGVESCSESSDRCEPGTTTCPAGQLCEAVADVCLTTCSGCVIGGVCYATNTRNPANWCQICSPVADATGWTNDTGAACDDNLFCTVGETCSSAGACVGGASRGCDDGVACNGAESCNESLDRCDSGMTTCAAGTLCNTTTDSCAPNCGSGTTPCGSACVNTTNDPNNCGGCGTTCPTVTNASAVCLASNCRTVCNAGFGDCLPAAGCETDTTSDASHCGACGNPCASGLVCRNSACVVPTYASCKALLAAVPTATSGVYTIDPDGDAGPNAPFSVYCEMDTAGGGWTVTAYLRASSQWSTPTFSNIGTVGDTAGGFTAGATLSAGGLQLTERIIIYRKIIELGVDLGQQWMISARADNVAVPFSSYTLSSGWNYRDSYGYVDASVSDVCSHGCGSYRGLGMFHNADAEFGWAGTQGGDRGCRDGNNICWMPRSLGCNVGSQRCAYLTGVGEGVIYGAR